MTKDPRFGVVGKQKVKDLGVMTIERMKTYDDETLEQSIDFMRRAIKDDKPFFVWHNTTRTHTFTHLRKKYSDMIPEKGLMGAAMTELDDTVGALLKELEDLGIDDNTIVVFTSDNGAMKFIWTAMTRRRCFLVRDRAHAMSFITSPMMATMRRSVTTNGKSRF
jgi:arylsulfatase A-like enzyme